MPLLLDDEVLLVARLARLSVAPIGVDHSFILYFLLIQYDDGTARFHGEAVSWKDAGQ